MNDLSNKEAPAPAALLVPYKTTLTALTVAEYLAKTAAPEDVKEAAEHLEDWVLDQPFDIRGKLEDLRENYPEEFERLARVRAAYKA
jgi:hypothetical protein